MNWARAPWIEIIVGVIAVGTLFAIAVILAGSKRLHRALMPDVIAEIREDERRRTCAEIGRRIDLLADWIEQPPIGAATPADVAEVEGMRGAAQLAREHVCVTCGTADVWKPRDEGCSRSWHKAVEPR